MYNNAVFNYITFLESIVNSVKIAIIVQRNMYMTYVI